LHPLSQSFPEVKSSILENVSQIVYILRITKDLIYNTWYNIIHEIKNSFPIQKIYAIRQTFLVFLSIYLSKLI